MTRRDLPGPPRVAVIDTHYDRLQLKPGASADEVRHAYRRLARIHHPDAAGSGDPSSQMAEINEAWRVLSDPARRAMYDAQLRGITVAPAKPKPTGKLDEEIYPVEPRSYHARGDGPPPFPGKLIAGAVIAAMIVGFIISGVANRGGPTTPVLNPVPEVGDCVALQLNGDGKKVACTDPHDGVVVEIVPFDGDCSLGTEPHRDSQGMGVLCIGPG